MKQWYALYVFLYSYEIRFVLLFYFPDKLCISKLLDWCLFTSLLQKFIFTHLDGIINKNVWKYACHIKLNINFDNRIE